MDIVGLAPRSKEKTPIPNSTTRVVLLRFLFFSFKLIYILNNLCLHITIRLEIEDYCLRMIVDLLHVMSCVADSMLKVLECHQQKPFCHLKSEGSFLFFVFGTVLYISRINSPYAIHFLHLVHSDIL